MDRPTVGTDGVSVKAPKIFGWAIRADDNAFCIILAVTVVMYIVARRIVESKIGRSFVAIRENEIVAQCNGINVAKTKAVVFGLSAFYAGIGDSLFAMTLGYIVPDGFGLFQLIIHFSVVVIGGLISMFGSVIGSIILTALPEVLRGFQALQEIVYGLLLMSFIVFMPTGMAGLAKKLRLLPDEILSRNWRARVTDESRVDRVADVDAREPWSLRAQGRSLSE